ncbi:hypothetical protein JCM10212_003780 [Sporobolomyces blumeae]
MSSEPSKKKQRTNAIPSSALPVAQSDLGSSVLPVSRVNRIIKADADVNLCSKEAIFLIAKATEHMIATMTAQAHANARMKKTGKSVKLIDLATVATHPQWFYLTEVIPLPIKLSDAKQRRQENDDLLNASIATTAAAGGGERTYEGKKVMKGGKRKSLVAAAAGGGGGGAAGGAAAGPTRIAEVEQRKTRGKKLNLPAGEGGPDEEDDFDDEPASRATSDAGGMDVDG